MTELMQASDEGAALEALHAAGMTDGCQWSFRHPIEWRVWS